MNVLGLRGVTLIVAAQACSCASTATPSAPAASTPVIEMSDDMVLSDADVAAVLEIGCELGLSNVDQVIAGRVAIPSGPLGVRLLRTEQTEPTVLRRRILIVTRVDDDLDSRLDASRVTVGGWESSSASLFEDELRRVPVDDGHVDIQVTDDVAYDVAVRLVSAVLRRRVPLAPEWSSGETIGSVGRVEYDSIPAGHQDSDQHDVYQVSTSTAKGGAGRILVLCLEGSDVVLIETGVWIA